MNLAQTILDAARQDPDHVAVKLDDAELSYRMLDGATAHLAGLLRAHGVKAGDRVGIMLPNVPYFPVCYYGILRAGAIVVPMNVLLKKREVGFYLKDPEAKLLFAWDGFAEAAQTGAEEAGAECLLIKPGEFENQVGAAEALTEVADTADGDTAVILYTSGTTGQPKGAELSNANLARNAEAPRVACSAWAPRPSCSARCRCFTPSARPADERHPRRRRDADPDPALRSGQGARDHPARRGQRVPGRADHVRRDAAPRQPRRLRRLDPEGLRSPAARRCRWS